jgi:putative two-component system response regulator
MSATVPTTGQLSSSPGAVIGPNEAAQIHQTDGDPTTGRIMMVDDEPCNAKVVQLFLEDHGYGNFVSITDSRQALASLGRQPPDVLLLDVNMPHVSGLDILASIRDDEHLSHMPVILVTASDDTAIKRKALELGASDYLSKPVDRYELLLRLRNALATKAYQDQLQRYSENLEHKVRLRTAELEASKREIIRCLAQAAEYRDDDTGRHVVRVGKYAGVIARRLGFNDSQVEMIEQAAQLHDIGKIGISDAILLKPGRLESHEFEAMKKHCEIGKSIIQPACDAVVQLAANKLGVECGLHGSPFLQMAARIAGTHHERWDGSGYPQGLAGEQIPIEGRITAVADVYDALSSVRPYKPAYPESKCLTILENGRGRHFDPRVLDAFYAATAEIMAIQTQFADV